MKVILLQEVRGKGGEGDVVEVARGFAVNYLFPKKLAVEATTGNVKQLDARRHNIEKRETARRAEAEGMATTVAGTTVYVEAKAGDEGKLFGSVTAQMIADAITAQLGVDVDRRKVDAHGHIKTVGGHGVTVQLHKEVKVDLTVMVVPEGAPHEPVEIPTAVKAEPVAAPVAEEPEADEAEDADTDEPVDTEETEDEAEDDESEAR